MYPWEYTAHRSAAQPEPSERGKLTAEEIARLTAVRAKYRGHPKCVEFALDERRLAFARWQVECGLLSEEL